MSTPEYQQTPFEYVSMTGKKALIVDDSKLAQFVLKRMLTEHNIVVDMAESAEEALGYLVHEKPDVIFMDHTMSGMNGLQALKVIKGNPDTAMIPVMMYTSQDNGLYMSQARALGAIDILPKQLKPVELEKVLLKLNLASTSLKTTPEITDTDEEMTPTQFAANEQAATNDTEELSKLVREAEAVLEKETLKQFVHQELEKQSHHFSTILKNINNHLEELSSQGPKTSLDALLDDIPVRTQRSNILWPLLFLVGTITFGGLYHQLNHSANTLKAVAATPPPPYSNAASAETRANSNANIDQATTTALLAALESSLNFNNETPYGTALLGDKALQKLFSITTSLTTTNFHGELRIIAHTGVFCLANNGQGELILPEESILASECQVVEPIMEIEQIATPKLLQFVNDINIDPNKHFIITLESQGGTEPRAHYPSISLKTLAKHWNQIAQYNRRVEFILNELN